ncbi:MAG: hypothetical protein VYA67_22070 [Actinomycetota bacterium]|nr:hypothetical protein [Actinomycetota bacterium]
MADLVTLVCRTDGTWDHRWYPPITEQTARAAVVKILRDIAGQIEAGADVPNPTTESS